MPVVLRFASSSQANGLTARAFQRSSSGVGLFFNPAGPVPTKVVSQDRAVFTQLTPPVECAFTLESPAGTRFRSGPLLINPASVPRTDTYLIIDAGLTTLTPAQLLASLPAVPMTRGAATLTSMALTINAGSFTINGTGTYASPFGPIPLGLTYVFTLDPVNDPADYRFPGGIPPAVDVRTISMTAMPMVTGSFGWLANALVTILLAIMQNTLRMTVEGAVQSAIDTALTTRLAASGAPAGTIATVETLTIAPGTGLTLHPFAGLSMEKLCPASGSGGSLNLRAPEQLAHLRAIRDRMLTRSPQGRAYVDLYEQFSEELMRAVIEDPKLLALADKMVAKALRAFPAKDPGRGRLPPALAADVRVAMQKLKKVASPELAFALASLEPDVRTFVGRPAGAVLDASFKLIQDPGAAEKPGRRSARTAKPRRRR
jgi:hypothetical protein